MQAKDLDDRQVLQAVVDAAIAKHGPSGGLGADRWTLSEMFPTVTGKVVLAKCHALLRRDLINGCVCGCRGDFNLTEKGRLLLGSH
jgi:hypothetical protein